MSNDMSVTHAGEKAVTRYQLIVLANALNMCGRTNGRLIPTRGFSLTKGVKMATSYTGKPYKRTQWEQAVADLRAKAEEVTAQLTVTTDPNTNSITFEG